MALASGTRLGPYEVIFPIGKGGMGEVYRARDTRLERDVAIKVLPDELAADEGRVARFEREAKLLASLNHPNIATLYGFEESDGVKALVLELVEGPTLADRVAQGPIPVDEAIALATQIAEALEAGHEAGVIHRDLKPANVKLKEDGTVKVLDYGLAKALEGDAVGSEDSDLSQSPTLTRQGTQIGVILGTAAYMSPEQAKGKRVDKRTDIFAFGAVLFEMLTGKRAFDGDSASDVLASVIKLEPDWDALPSGRASSVNKLLHRCLEKDSRRRLRDIGDARFELLEVEDGDDEDATGRSPNQAVPLWWRLIPWVSVAAVGALALLVFSGDRASRPEVTRFAMSLPQGTVLTRGSGVAVSPDGRTIVYSASDAEHGGERLYRRDMDALESVPIRGTEGAQRPFFSPDGESVGFFTTYEVKKVPLSGGISVRLAGSQGQDTFIGEVGGTWLEDDSIVFVGGTGAVGFRLSRVSASGGDLVAVASATENGEEVSHSRPAALPDGRGYVSIGQTRGSSQVYLHRPGGGAPVALVPGRQARVSPSGHLVFERDGTLWAAELDIEEARVTSDPVAVVETFGSSTTTNWIFDLSSSGSLVYGKDWTGTWPNRSLYWVTRDGQEERLEIEPKPYWFPRVSPTGDRIGFHIMDPENMDAYTHDLSSGATSRLTYDQAVDNNPIWAPDGERVVFGSFRETGVGNLFTRAADGTGPVERLTSSPNRQEPLVWTKDGLIVFTEESPETSSDIWTIAPDGDRTPEPLLHELYAESRPAVSPDGRWIAYQSSESGQWQIWVRPFPDVERGRWQVGSGGVSPQWSPDNRELFYRGDNAMMAVRIDTTNGFSAGPATRLFEDRYVTSPREIGAFRPEYAVAPDGRFLMMKDMPESETEPELIVVRNWAEELKRLFPANN